MLVVLVTHFLRIYFFSDNPIACGITAFISFVSGSREGSGSDRLNF